MCGERSGAGRVVEVVTRFIPACAGNARDNCVCYCVFAVHPRVCGEREVTLESNLPGDGSSPRVRGTRERAFAGTRSGRFIPACAGNAPRPPAPPPRPPVHPRVCGERGGALAKALGIDGSSPRVRGTHPLRFGFRLRFRFIPACAGNAPVLMPGRKIWPVHPRVCGERTLTLGRELNQTGSSPRVRGTRWQNHVRR